MKWNDETSCNCFKWDGEGFVCVGGVEDGGGNLTNVQYEAVWSCHNESPLISEYVLIKMAKNKIK
jgi:hypothetical protein